MSTPSLSKNIFLTFSCHFTTTLKHSRPPLISPMTSGEELLAFISKMEKSQAQKNGKLHAQDGMVFYTES